MLISADQGCSMLMTCVNIDINHWFNIAPCRHCLAAARWLPRGGKGVTALLETARVQNGNPQSDSVVSVQKVLIRTMCTNIAAIARLWPWGAMLCTCIALSCSANRPALGYLPLATHAKQFT